MSSSCGRCSRPSTAATCRPCSTPTTPMPTCRRSPRSSSPASPTGGTAGFASTSRASRTYGRSSASSRRRSATLATVSSWSGAGARGGGRAAPRWSHPRPGSSRSATGGSSSRARTATPRRPSAIRGRGRLALLQGVKRLRDRRLGLLDLLARLAVARRAALLGRRGELCVGGLGTRQVLHQLAVLRRELRAHVGVLERRGGGPVGARDRLRGLRLAAAALGALHLRDAGAPRRVEAVDRVAEVGGIGVVGTELVGLA